MKGEEAINMCQAVSHGSARYVRNVRDNRKGLVMAADGMDVHVQVGSGHETWHLEDCEEAGYSAGQA